MSLARIAQRRPLHASSYFHFGVPFGRHLRHNEAMKPIALTQAENVYILQGRPPVGLELPTRAKLYPDLRYMGSKTRLLPWIFETLNLVDFESALDPFSGTGCVSYLMKAMGRRVAASDFLNFTSTVARATVENNHVHLDDRAIKRLLDRSPAAHRFIERTFGGVFYTPEDLRFLDRVSGNIRQLQNPHQQALAFAALFRSCLKRQPRGVFTISGDLSHYDDGRRDLRLSIEEHFLEQIEVYNAAVFDNGRKNQALRSDVFELPRRKVDLVYLDPPYVPRSDDNCYIKRYHFLEGLSCYWQGLPVDTSTKVRKIAKKYTPFSYRRTAVDAFDKIFNQFKANKIALSYSSNGYPDLDQLESLMRKYKSTVRIFEKPHRYHFGTHGGVERASVTEYLIVGS
ncbi:DNA adenine methylase [Beijerinckia indica]|uniref:site-specific DNA-methyltransferase (adenine-specific) n=1 Tax=Beijerinckia indica subsp. indica (strain ATCC 9039 / DSM 1715 / NCIMB 8712) TaxID=395963 RepID=B2IAX8_BEII9|nr:DNA adenine methylase [Beijerinckia indica]ACB93678.1 D12 class N6 adenine-specific DNA methyltransferase [Beijerinckia indica subsp. indica ATCC 9039]